MSFAEFLESRNIDAHNIEPTLRAALIRQWIDARERRRPPTHRIVIAADIGRWPLQAVRR